MIRSSSGLARSLVLLAFVGPSACSPDPVDFASLRGTYVVAADGTMLSINADGTGYLIIGSGAGSRSLSPTACVLDVDAFQTLRIRLTADIAGSQGSSKDQVVCSACSLSADRKTFSCKSVTWSVGGHPTSCEFERVGAP
jgi:hypothetical protein